MILLIFLYEYMYIMNVCKILLHYKNHAFMCLIIKRCVRLKSKNAHNKCTIIASHKHSIFITTLMLLLFMFNVHIYAAYDTWLISTSLLSFCIVLVHYATLLTLTLSQCAGGREMVEAEDENVVRSNVHTE